MSETLNQIKGFWEEQAKKYQGSSLATSPDTIAFEMEVEQMKKYIPSGSKVLDIGCGNGVKGIELAKVLEIEYFGLDFSAEMIRQAKLLHNDNLHLLKGNATFEVGNILEKDSLPHENFDIVMTDRCLINLQTIDNQITAIRHIHSVLKDQGTYLMFENSLQSLENLNEVRRTYALSDIEVRWHNIYIDETLVFPAINDCFKLLQIDSFASTYYLISRTLNALLIAPNEEVDYNSHLNKLAAHLPALGDFSPLKLFVLEKV